jgi:putative endonuclease
MNWHVYILECKDKTLYTGITNNLEKRILIHNAGKGSKSLLGKLPVKLVYNETLINRSEASIREAQIKKLTRDQKIELITGR